MMETPNTIAFKTSIIPQSAYQCRIGVAKGHHRNNAEAHYQCVHAQSMHVHFYQHSKLCCYHDIHWPY